MMEEGADEKLQREVEEQLKLAELERLMMQEEKESGDLQVCLMSKILIPKKILWTKSLYSKCHTTNNHQLIKSEQK